MFNSELKEEFIKQRNSEAILDKNFLKRLFVITEEYEDQLNKDVSNFTVYEIMNMYKGINSISLERIQNINTQLSYYTQYCLQNNLVRDCQNHYLEIKPDNVFKCINVVALIKRIYTRDQILRWCNTVFADNPSDKFILLGMFEGLGGNNFIEITEAKVGDIDEQNLTMKTILGRTIPISNTLINYAKESDITLEYTTLGSTRRIRKLFESGKIIKYYRKNATEELHQQGRRIYIRIKKMFAEVASNQYLSTKSLADSGRCHYIITRCKELKITPYDYLFSDRIEEVNKIYLGGIVRSTFWKKYGGYLENQMDQ